MPIDKLDRTAWSLNQTYQHICRICRARYEAATGEKVVLDIGKILSPTAPGTSRWQNINLDAQRQLFSAQQSLITDRLAQLTSEVNLYKALGGGWNEQTAKNEPLKEEAPPLKLF